MRDDNTQDDAGPSPASAGSKPVAWAVTIGPQNDRSVYEAFAAHQKDGANALAPLAGLFFSPTLTDEERFALREVRDICADADDVKCNEIAAVIDGLLERLG